MSTDTQTQSIPRVPATFVAVTDVGVAAPARDTQVAVESDTEATASAARDRDSEDSHEVARGESVEHIYEAGLAKLAELHDRWAAAMAEIGQAPASGEPERAAA